MSWDSSIAGSGSGLGGALGASFGGGGSGFGGGSSSGGSGSFGVGAFGSHPADFPTAFGSGGNWDWNGRPDGGDSMFVQGGGGDLGAQPTPAPLQLPSAQSSTTFDLFRPTNWGYSWNENQTQNGFNPAFFLLNNPNARQAFVSGQAGTQDPFAWAQANGGNMGYVPMPSNFAIPQNQALPEAPQQGGFNPFFAARDMGGVASPGTGSLGTRGLSAPAMRTGTPNSRLVGDQLAGLGSFQGWQDDWQARRDAEEARRGEGAREAGLFGMTNEEFARAMAQARGLSDPSALVQVATGQRDNFGPTTMNDFGAIERMQSNAPVSGWGIGGSTTTTRTPFDASGTVGWNESTTANPFDARFDPASFPDVTSRQAFMQQRGQDLGGFDWTSGLARQVLGGDAFNALVNYQRPWDPGFAGFDPTFEILNEERGRLEPAFQNRERLQQSFDNMTAAGSEGGLLPENYTDPGFGLVTGQANPGMPIGEGLTAMGDGEMFTGVFDPRRGTAPVYRPGGLGGMGGLG